MRIEGVRLWVEAVRFRFQRAEDVFGVFHGLGFKRVSGLAIFNRPTCVSWILEIDLKSGVLRLQVEA